MYLKISLLIHPLTYPYVFLIESYHKTPSHHKEDSEAEEPEHHEHHEDLKMIKYRKSKSEFAADI
jgi:hypothetical protein